jgi:hypothetical protein
LIAVFGWKVADFYHKLSVELRVTDMYSKPPQITPKRDLCMTSTYLSISRELLELIEKTWVVPTGQSPSTADQARLSIINGLQELRDVLAIEREVSEDERATLLLPLPEPYQTATLYTADQMRAYALMNGVQLASLHSNFLRRQLQSVRKVKEDALEALTAISEIEDKLNGGDWDEIEEARGIANAALSACEPYAEVLPANPLLC